MVFDAGTVDHLGARVRELGNGHVHLSRRGLLQVDALLPEFYEEKYRNVRYT